jgi:hypothetical protein
VPPPPSSRRLSFAPDFHFWKVRLPGRQQPHPVLECVVGIPGYA